MSYKIARHRRLDDLGVPEHNRRRRRGQLEYLPQDMDAGLRLYHEEFSPDEQREWDRVEADRSWRDWLDSDDEEDNRQDKDGQQAGQDARQEAGQEVGQDEERSRKRSRSREPDKLDENRPPVTLRPQGSGLRLQEEALNANRPTGKSSWADIQEEEERRQRQEEEKELVDEVAEEVDPKEEQLDSGVEPEAEQEADEPDLRALAQEGVDYGDDELDDQNLSQMAMDLPEEVPEIETQQMDAMDMDTAGSAASTAGGLPASRTQESQEDEEGEEEKTEKKKKKGNQQTRAKKSEQLDKAMELMKLKIEHLKLQQALQEAQRGRKLDASLTTERVMTSTIVLLKLSAK